MGPPPSRDPGQQTAPEVVSSTWLLRMYKYVRPAATRLEPHPIYPSREQFGVKYIGKEHVDHLIQCVKEKINSPRIGLEIYIAGSSQTGITA